MVVVHCSQPIAHSTLSSCFPICQAIQYQFVAGPGDPLNLGDRITDTYFPAIDWVLDKKVSACCSLPTENALHDKLLDACQHVNELPAKDGHDEPHKHARKEVNSMRPLSQDIPSQLEYDLLHLNAVLGWIKGNFANGTSAGAPFNLFGSTFQVLGCQASPLWPGLLWQPFQRGRGQP